MISGMNPALHAAAHLVTLRVMQSLAEGSLVTLFAVLILARPGQNARTRSAVWFSSLIAIAAVPVISGEWLWSAKALPGQPAVTVPDSCALYLFGAWAVIAAWLLLGVARGLAHLWNIRKSCVEIETATLDPFVRETLLRHRGRREVILCKSPNVRVPTALGLINPAVVIPDWLMRELSPVELNQILLHELAHLRRWDDWTNLVQQLIKAIFFFHPAVWWIEKKVALEREMACDDAVLAETGSPRLYAECLARLAEKSFVQRSVVLAQAALGKIRQTTLRVTRILDPQRPSVTSRSLVPAVSLIAVLSVGCGLWTARASRLIAFEGGTAVPTISAETYHESQSPISDLVAKSVPAIARPSQMPGVTPAKLILGTAHSKRVSAGAMTRSRSTHSAPRAEQLVKSVSAKAAAVPMTETIFLVIENQGPDLASAPGYQIQMWRLTVFRTIVDSAPQIPRKQT
jgi:beta-lactamase regulating signal transducer with metallopeptidase domain